MLAHGPVVVLEPGDSVVESFTRWADRLSFEDHLPPGKLAFQFERRSPFPDPKLLPLSLFWIVEVEARSCTSFHTGPGFLEDAAAQDGLDRVGPGQCTAGKHFPFTNPEIELVGLLVSAVGGLG